MTYGGVPGGPGKIDLAALRREAERQAKIAAKREAEKAAKAQAEIKPKPEAAKPSFLDRLTDTVEGVATKVGELHEQQVKDSKQEIARLEQDLGQLKSAGDVKDAAGRAARLREASEGLPERMQAQVAKLDAKAQRTLEAVEEVERLEAAVEGEGPEQAAALAKVLARPEAVQRSLEGLGAMKDTPFARRAERALGGLEKAATPENLAAALEASPNLTDYPPETAADLAALRGQHPRLEQALDAVSLATLNREGGVSMETIKAHPDFARLVGASQDPAVQAKAAETAEGWAREAIGRHLEGAEGKDETQEAMAAFKEEMVALAEETGLGTAISQGVENGLAAEEGQIEDHAKAGGGLFGSIKNAVGDVLGGLGDIVGDIAGAVKDQVQKGLDGAFMGVSSFVSKGAGMLGDVADFAVDNFAKISPPNLLAKGAALGLDAVGLDGAADTMRDVSAGIEKAGDFVGDQVGNFTKGAGDALGGTIQGVGTMLVHPVQTVQSMAYLATHPGQLPEVGKALWKEATKHGAAGAVGYVAANLAPMLLTGGGGAAALGAKGASMARAGQAAQATRFAGVAGKGMELLGTGMQKGAQLFAAGRQLRFSGSIKGAAEVMLRKTDDLVREGTERSAMTFGDKFRVIKDGFSDMRNPEVKAWQRSWDGGGDGPQALTLKEAKVKAKEAIKDESLDARATGLEVADVSDGVWKRFSNTRGFKLANEGLKLGARGMRAITDPVDFLSREAKGVISRRMNPDIYRKISGAPRVRDLDLNSFDPSTAERLSRLDPDTVIGLTSKRAAVHDMAGRLNAQVTGLEEYQALKDEAKELVVAAVGEVYP